MNQASMQLTNALATVRDLLSQVECSVVVCERLLTHLSGAQSSPPALALDAPTLRAIVSVADKHQCELGELAGAPYLRLMGAARNLLHVLEAEHGK